MLRWTSHELPLSFFLSDYFTVADAEEKGGEREFF
jgi:hypothetical protein